jgi:hypothetical protein
MPDHIEVETQELQEKIQELNEERVERNEEEKKTSWIRYIGLSTAILAVFAAVAALQSGNLVNEALVHQLKASDTWSEYQASRQKDHLYTLTLNDLLDANAKNPAMAAAMNAPIPKAAKPAAKTSDDAKAPPAPTYAAKSAPMRAAEYRAKIYDEMSKESSRSAQATELEKQSEEEIEHHHRFEYAVALMQVAIALGAVSALTRVKPVWFFSLFAGACGVVLFAFGFVA